MNKPKIRTTWITPLGEFPSANQACTALKCDRTTLYNRVEKGMEGYGRVERESVPRVVVKRPGAVKLPLWTEYRYLPFEQRESIYHAWCKKQKLDPESEDAANLFFDDMDSVVVEETQD